MNIKKILATAAAVALLPIAGSAATLSLSGGTGGVGIPGEFGPLEDVFGAVATPADLLAPLTVFDSTSLDGDGLYVTTSKTARITLTYVGYEARNTNSASSTSAGLSTFVTDTSANGDTITFDQKSGLVDLTFATDGKITTPCAIANGYVGGSTCQIAFSSLLSGDTATYVMFGDGIGDSDLDDIVFRVDVSEVPVPAAGFLLIGGLGAMAALRRRKKA
jgi:hypothetical protein